jgi:hypothetical protein
MDTVLFIIIAVLLSIIGLLLHAAESLGKGFDGMLSWLTQNMGPGVSYKAKKSFPTTPVVFYGLSLFAIILAFVSVR